MNPEEVYPNAPVVLVTMEIRHPPAELTPSQSQALKRLLAKRLPIERAGQQMSVTISASGTAPASTVDHFARYLNRESTAAAAIRKQSILVETSAYSGWNDFLGLLLLVVEARTQISSIIGIERVGLRYIDEVRIHPTSATSVDWSQWINGSLLGPQSDAPVGLPLAEWQGAAVYRESQPGRSLVLRYGPRLGYAVDPNSDLRRVRTVEPGAFFLMDIDSFWTPSGTIPEYNREQLLSIYEDLHRPVRILFEDMITDRLRDEVLRRDD